MKNFIIKRFIKNYKETGNPNVRAAYGNVASITGIICNVLLAAAKGIAGFYPALWQLWRTHSIIFRMQAPPLLRF